MASYFTTNITGVLSGRQCAIQYPFIEQYSAPFPLSNAQPLQPFVERLAINLLPPMINEPQPVFKYFSPSIVITYKIYMKQHKPYLCRDRGEL